MIRLPEQTDPPAIWHLLENYEGVMAYDIGANIGQVARLLAPHFGNVEAFEPCLEAFDILTAETPANVCCHAVAVSSLDGEVTLTESEYSIASGQLTTGRGLNWGREVGQRAVPCVMLDTLIGTLEVPDFVKVDTEGHEVDVISGGSRLWAAFRPKLLIEVHDRENELMLRAMLEGFYRIDRIEHDYLVDNPMGQDHFWLRCEAR